MKSSSIQFAVLDINLGFENSLGFATVLRGKGVPFIFASGYGTEKAGGESPIAELIASKPYDREALHGAIIRTLARVA